MQIRILFQFPALEIVHKNAVVERNGNDNN